MNKVGKNYMEFLASVKHFLICSAYVFQEDLEVIRKRIGPGHGARCNYDMCPQKHARSNETIQIYHSKGRVQRYSFHSDCLANLVNDQRFPFQN